MAKYPKRTKDENKQAYQDHKTHKVTVWANEEVEIAIAVAAAAKARWLKKVYPEKYGEDFELPSRICRVMNFAEISGGRSRVPKGNNLSEVTVQQLRDYEENGGPWPLGRCRFHPTHCQKAIVGYFPEDKK